MYSKLSLSSISVIVMCICFYESSGHYFFTVECMLSLPHPQNYGFSKLTANATTLVFEFITDSDNEVHDRLVLEN